MTPTGDNRDHVENLAGAELSPAELAFLAKAGVPESTFSAAAQSATEAYIAASAAAMESLIRSWLPTTEVAEHLHCSVGTVRRMAAQGALSAAKTTSGRLMFAPWQFDPDRQVLPGLSAVIAAAPSVFAPVVLASFMTRPDEELSDATPRDWLLNGQDPAVVVRILEDLSWT